MRPKNFLYLFVLLGIIPFCTAQTVKLDSLNQILKTDITKEQKAQIFLEKGKAFEDINQDSTDFFVDKAFLLASELDLPHKKIEALLIKAQRNIVKGAYEASASLYEQADGFLSENEFVDLRITYYGDLGILNFYQGDFKSALYNFQTALKLAKSEKDEVAELRFLNNTALAMSYLNDGEAAIKVHENAIHLAKKLKDSASLGRSLNNLGLIYEDMEEYERALKFYESALKVKEKVGTPVDLLNSRYNVAGMQKEIAEINLDTLLLQNTRAEFHQIFKDAKAIQYGKVQLFTQSGIAQIETALGNYKQAIFSYRQLIKKADSLNDGQTLRVSLLNLGINQLKLKRVGQGLASLLKAKEAIERSNNPSDKNKLYENLALAYEAKRDYKLALTYRKLSDEIKESLASERLQNKISEFEVSYETEKKENEILAQRAQLAENTLEIQKKRNQVYLAVGIALMLGLLGYLFYSQQKTKNRQLKKEAELQTALARVETQNKLQEQRLRISRDLHDNIGSQLTFVISSLDNLGYGLKKKDGKIKNRLADIAAFTKITIGDLRDTIWAMNKEYITLEDLTVRILNLLDNAEQSVSGVGFTLQADKEIASDYRFTALAGVHIYRVVQEAINNAIKHAFDEESKNNSVHVKILETKDDFKVIIQDNGKGFIMDAIELGNGIENMKKRVLDIGGTFSMSPAIEKGVKVLLVLPKKTLSHD